MILSKRVALGGVQLDELHERIVVQSVDPGAPEENISTATPMGRWGERITGAHWTPLEVKITYGIDVSKDPDIGGMELRREIFDLVNTWARKAGWLTYNAMPNKRVYIDKVVLPSAGDLWNWTESFDIILRAYNVPFWQDESAQQVTSAMITNGNMIVPVGGNMTTVLDAEFKNISGKTINNFYIAAGGNSLTLSSLGLGGTSTLLIHHGTDGMLRITAGGASAYSKRTGSDDLYVEPGNVNVTIRADRAGALTLRSFGRYA